MYIELLVDSPNVTVNSQEFVVIDNFNVWPTQEMKELYPDAPDPEFNRNDSVYNVNDYYPVHIVNMSRPLICRGHKISKLAFFPFQFNPVTKKLKVYQSIDITVHGAGSNSSALDDITFDEFLNNSVLNYKKGVNTDNVIDLLILTIDEYKDDLSEFKEWKEKTGVRTKIVSQSDLENGGYQWYADNDPDEIYSGIDAYIKNAYDTWGDSVPEYILCIGEPDTVSPQMPTHYWNSSLTTAGKTATDIYYTTMNLNETNTAGDFDFPDIHQGRITADSRDELHIVLNKIINYERSPYIGNTDWYRKIDFNAQFEPKTNIEHGGELVCESARYFVYTSETISSYLSSIGFNTRRNYYTDCESDPKYWEWGEEAPPTVPFIYDETVATNNVINQINEGSLIVNHRGHGNSRNSKTSDQYEGWRRPSFNENHFDLLDNGEMLPLMFSMNCQTGWFDGAGDDPWIHPHFQMGNFDCMGEILLAKENGGIVGFIGATRSSASGYNDELCKGFYDAIWSDFDPFNSEVQTPTYRLGAIKNHGLFYMFDKYVLGNTSVLYDWWEFKVTNAKTLRNFEEFHVLGDPTMEIWTDVPQPIFADIDYENQMVTVYDDNGSIVKGARVVLRNGDTFEVLLSNSGGQVSSALLLDVSTKVSVLKHNYIPWFTKHLTENQDWDPAKEIRGNIVVESGCDLTLAQDLVLPKYAKIVVADGGNLVVNNSVQVEFSNSYGGILALGHITMGSRTAFVMNQAGEAAANIKLKNETAAYTFSTVNFKNCDIKGIPGTLTISDSKLNGGKVQIEKANVSISDTRFDNASISISHARSKSGFANVSNCTISECTIDALYIEGYPDYTIHNNTITKCNDAIRIFNSGETEFENLVDLNQIYNNSGTGITVYHSQAEIELNGIWNNQIGIQCLDRSNVKIEGNRMATVESQTQIIKDNSGNEIYATHSSFPYFMKWNAVVDEDNTNPLVYYSSEVSQGLDVANNNWGTNFNPLQDLAPSGSYIYAPIWNYSDPSGIGDAEAKYNTAQAYVNSNDYKSAKTEYQQLVAQYPNTTYAQAALRELFSIEELTGNQYAALKMYYQTESVIQQNPALLKLADFLANYCDIKISNYPSAISWFEDVIMNPESVPDSIFAIIDLGYTYFLMENGGLKNNFAAKLPEHRPINRKSFEKNRDYLLSLLKAKTKKEDSEEELQDQMLGTLLRNVPNPFNESTDIYYEIKGDGNASIGLTIRDFTGKIIDHKQFGQLESGEYKYTFQSSGQPAGIYFYTLEINANKVDSKKMILVK